MGRTTHSRPVCRPPLDRRERVGEKARDSPLSSARADPSLAADGKRMGSLGLRWGIAVRGTDAEQPSEQFLAARCRRREEGLMSISDLLDLVRLHWKKEEGQT